jgi:hypothetical protein
LVFAKTSQNWDLTSKPEDKAKVKIKKNTVFWIYVFVVSKS